MKTREAEKGVCVCRTLGYEEIDTMKTSTAAHVQAATDAEYLARTSEENDYRSPYRRDADRILQSKAYARYVDKTQVVYLIDNDHISQRGLHVQLVSGLARGIGRALGLHLDLIEAIALGHDVGHPPFGHEGEGYLSHLACQHGLDPFSHPAQSCRLFTDIEPLNLGLQVYDGILCHDGGMQDTRMEPRFYKEWADHEKDLKMRALDPEVNLIPMTLEGCLVKFCDTVSYVGRDLEDAINMGIIERHHVPLTGLGQSNSSIQKAFAEDLIRHSKGHNHIAVSEETYQSIRKLRDFNFTHIYKDPRLKVESRKIRRSYRVLFQFLLENLQAKAEDSYIWGDFLSTKSADYRKDTSAPQMVVDYIAGMTDGFFLRTLQRIFVPSQIEWTCTP